MYVVLRISVWMYACMYGVMLPGKTVQQYLHSLVEGMQWRHVARQPVSRRRRSPAAACLSFCPMPGHLRIANRCVRRDGEGGGGTAVIGVRVVAVGVVPCCHVTAGKHAERRHRVEERLVTCRVIRAPLLVQKKKTPLYEVSTRSVANVLVTVNVTHVPHRYTAVR